MVTKTSKKGPVDGTSVVWRVLGTRPQEMAVTGMTNAVKIQLQCSI